MQNRADIEAGIAELESIMEDVRGRLWRGNPDDLAEFDALDAALRVQVWRLGELANLERTARELECRARELEGRAEVLGIDFSAGRPGTAE